MAASVFLQLLHKHNFFPVIKFLFMFFLRYTTDRVKLYYHFLSCSFFKTMVTNKPTNYQCSCLINKQYYGPLVTIPVGKSSTVDRFSWNKSALHHWPQNELRVFLDIQWHVYMCWSAEMGYFLVRNCCSLIKVKYHGNKSFANFLAFAAYTSVRYTTDEVTWHFWWLRTA